LREIKVFVSSPDDALQERKRLAQVVERLNGEIRGIATIRPVRWEKSFYKAHATFQTQIPEAAACDVVVGILRHRLGSPLPASFPKMPNGDAYPSGTAYEVLSALEQRRKGDLPDVYVFRYSEPPTVRLDDAGERRLVEDQWERVKTFFSDWFFTPEGQFKAAFQTFQSTDDFEKKIEALLRDWIEERVLHGRAVVWPVGVRGSPFRGLEAFDAAHAPVFFGRSRDIARAVTAFNDAADRGTPYLMVVGPSGAGKSSIARAGILPRLTAPGVIPQVDIWRVVIMRPGERGANPFAALAERLLQSEETDDGESGTREGLAEIAQSGFSTPKELTDLLAHADAASIRPVVHALDKVAEQEGAAAGYERPLNAALLLLVDQLDELLAADVPDDVRTKFAALLLALCRTGRVWVLTTLRADLYERSIAVPDLLTLKTDGASFDLQPPGPAELAEIVRLPAKAADLVYETDAGGRSLDERLLADAERADILPLVQFTLNRLFEQRINVDGEVRLTHAAYEAMGELDGAIDHEAERALASLGETEVRALPRLLRELATPARSADSNRATSLTIRAVPLERVVHDAPSERLVEALIEARILLATGDGSVRTVRIAHQRVLESWQRAKQIVAEHADFFRIRDEVEEERRRWEEAGRSGDRLIPRGLRLAEAESIQKQFRDEIPPAMRLFIQSSGNRARLSQRLTGFAAIVFFGVAIAAGYFGWMSRQHALAEQLARQDAQRLATMEHEASEKAQRNFGIARQTVDGMIAEIAEGLRGSAGVPIATIRKVLSNLESAVDRLNTSAPDEEGLQRSRLAMLVEFGATYASAGESSQALDVYNKAITLARDLLARHPDDPELQRRLAQALQQLGNTHYRIGKPSEAMEALNEALAIDRKLVVTLKDDPEIWDHISRCLNDIGDLKRRAGDSAGALADYMEGVEIGRRLVMLEPDNVGWGEGLAVSLIHSGDVQAALGEVEGSLESFAEGLATWRKISATDPGNLLWLHEVGMALNSIGDIQLGAGMFVEAKAVFEESLGIHRRLTRSDPGHRKWQGDLATSLERVGDIRVREHDLIGAQGAFEESLAIRHKLVEVDSGNLEWRRDVASSLFRIGDVRLRNGDAAGMQAAYAEGIDTLRALTVASPRNTRWKRNLAGALKTAGAQKYASGAVDEAMVLFDEARAIRRDLIAMDPANTYWQIELVKNLEDIAGQATGPYRASAIEEALAILEKLRREGALSESYAALENRLQAMHE
jgi:tetratricopeptide (TPR) repeat protein